jgi:integrase
MRRPPYLHVFKDRHGKQRAYFRKPGQPRVALPLPLYGEAFWTAYRAAEAGAAKPAEVTKGAAPGSISVLIEAYYRSAEWKALAPSSQATYRRQLERFRQAYVQLLVKGMGTAHVNRIMDQMSDRPAAANNMRDRLNVLMAFAVADGWREDNPVSKAKRVKHTATGFRTWTEADIEAFRRHWCLGTPQRLAMEILLHTGLRRSDAVLLGRQHVVGNTFVLTTVKSQGRTRLTIPIHPSLPPVLASVPADHLTFIVTAKGAARSDKAFTNWLREAAHAAGLPPSSSPHGLRKAACRRLAQAGCTPHEIMAITGHKALAEVDTYTREVNQAALAQTAIDRVVTAFDHPIEPRTSGKPPRAG